MPVLPLWIALRLAGRKRPARGALLAFIFTSAHSSFHDPIPYTSPRFPLRGIPEEGQCSGFGRAVVAGRRRRRVQGGGRADLELRKDLLMRSFTSSGRGSPGCPQDAPSAARRRTVSRIRRSCRLYLAQNLQMRRWRRTPIRFPRGREWSIDSERRRVTSLQDSIRAPSPSSRRTIVFPGTVAAASAPGGGSPRDLSRKRLKSYRSPRRPPPRSPGA